MSIETVQALFPGALPIPDRPNLFATPSGDLVSTRRRRPRRLSTYRVRNAVLISLNRYKVVEALRVAQLVCSTFHGPRPSPDHKALHRNGDWADNSAANLFWGTAHDLSVGKMDRGTQARGERHALHKLTEAEVIEIKRLLATTDLTQRAIAAEFNVCKSTVTAINTGKSWTYLWADPTQTPTTATVQGTCPPPEGRVATFSA